MADLSSRIRAVFDAEPEITAEEVRAVARRRKRNYRVMGAGGGVVVLAARFGSDPPRRERAGSAQGGSRACDSATSRYARCQAERSPVGRGRRLAGSRRQQHAPMRR